jgi:hypothetical protein
MHGSQMSSNLCLPDTGKGEEKMTANIDVEKESNIRIPQAEHNFDEQILYAAIKSHSFVSSS